MKNFALVLAAATVLGAPALASAATPSEKISTCSTEIRTQLEAVAPAVEIDFRKIKSTSRTSTVYFRIDADGQRDKVRCKATTGKPVEIKWGNTVKPTAAQLVKADAKAEKAGGQ